MTRNAPLVGAHRARLGGGLAGLLALTGFLLASFWSPSPGRSGAFVGVTHAQTPNNPALVAVLQGILRKYERCIIEKYETRETAGLEHRDVSTCSDGRSCSLASRRAAFARLQELARAGNPNGFEALLKSAVLKDCMNCGKHRKWHTKHTHCTMDCGGNNGIIKGPCFEGCKAGVDVNAFLRDLGAEIAKHAALFAGNFDGQGAQRLADSESSNTGVGATIATNRHKISPSDPESCDSSSKGYFVLPEDKSLLDWNPAGAGPSWNEFMTGYSPPGTVTPSTVLAAWSLPATLKVGGKGVGANEGRLRSDLRAVARAAKPLESLCKSAAAFAFGKTSEGRAFADLSVTGRRAYAAFSAKPPTQAEIVACLEQTARLRTLGKSALQSAANSALDRAYRVATVLRAGGFPERCPERAALGYIAVSGEDDQPHRPTNTPSAEFPQHDLAVRVGNVTVNTRYMIAEARGASPSCASQGQSLPRPSAPTLSADAEVILFIHGMDSRLEESLSLTRALHALGRARNKNYAVIAVDFPTSGYADNLDYNVISPLNAIGQATIPPGMMGFAPARGYKTPILDFNENFLVEFVKTLERKLPRLTQQIRAVVGGSMGGNLALRLGRPRADAPWIRNVIAWSPAGMWESKSDEDTEHIALALPWAFAGGDSRFLTEQPWSRNAFFYGGFDWQGKAAFIVNVTKPQAEEWFGPSYRCRDSAIVLSRLGRYETYDANFRRWHWRLAAEQLIFSHTIKRNKQPLYASNTLRTLLLCGIEDTGGKLCESTRGVAANMKYTPGHALWLEKTGHSLHDERTNFLSRHIADFITPTPPGLSLEVDVKRRGTAIQRASSVSPEACSNSCRTNTACRAYDYTRGVCTLLGANAARSFGADSVSGEKQR